MHRVILAARYYGNFIRIHKSSEYLSNLIFLLILTRQRSSHLEMNRRKRCQLFRNPLQILFPDFSLRLNSWSMGFVLLFYYRRRARVSLLIRKNKKRKEYLTFEKEKKKERNHRRSYPSTYSTRSNPSTSRSRLSFLIKRQISRKKERKKIKRKNDGPDKDTNDLKGQGEITLRRRSP